MYKLLLIEDSPDYAALVTKTLGARYQIHNAASLASARKFNSTNTYDLILLDVLLPDGNGFEYCTELQALRAQSSTPIVVLSGLGEVEDKVMGWSLGVDDYITKPFAPLEFQARIQGRIEKRRLQENFGGVLRWSVVTLDLSSHIAKIEEDNVEQKLDLTPIEFKILHFFVKNPERVFSRAQIIEAAWGVLIHVTERTVDKHISTLRHKFNSKKATIRTVSSVGYSLNQT